MAGPNADVVARVVTGREERQAVHMIEMGVRVEQVEIARVSGLKQVGAEVAHARAAVEDQQVLAATNFDAGGIAAITRGLGARAGNAAANSPEPNHEIRLRQRQGGPQIQSPRVIR